jgi:hypothetical protein
MSLNACLIVRCDELASEAQQAPKEWCSGRLTSVGQFDGQDEHTLAALPETYRFLAKRSPLAPATSAPCGFQQGTQRLPRYVCA